MVRVSQSLSCEGPNRSRRQMQGAAVTATISVARTNKRFMAVLRYVLECLRYRGIIGSLRLHPPKRSYRPSNK